MAEITRRRQGELVAGVFELLRDQPEGMPAKDVLSRLRERVPPTPFEASEYPNRPGVPRFEKIVRFSTIPFVKAGWLVKANGTWSASEEGLQALRRHPDSEEFMRQAVAAYRQWKRDRAEAEPEEEEIGERPPVSATLEEAEESAFEEIRSFVSEIGPYDFQDLIAALIEAMGYHVLWVAPPGPDRGIDIVASADQLGISDPRVKVQVKHRGSAADVGDLRSFLAVLGTHDVGIFVSTGGFTRDAQAEARSHETRKITLLDLERVLALWVANYERVDESRRVLLPLKPVYYLAPT
ncbi:MAG: restriction endonuclease [Actinomycetota bacterium]